LTARVLMIQGTASSVGKSVLVTALCRIFADEGLRVAPFKGQNMSNNSYVTPDGLEIGRAQAEQARAARLAPDVRMNPVLLKPEGNMRSQIVLLGRPAGTLTSHSFESKRSLWPQVAAALDSLREDYELIIVEGAGSPAEINLRRGDITNMRVARHAQAPVLLIGDIDNGGVFAHLVGTLALLTRTERPLVRGFIINKFRGDIELLKPGLEMLERRTNRPVVGVMPYLRDLQIAEEDAVALDRQRERRAAPAETKIAVIRLPHISNFDDFDPLVASAGVDVDLVYAARPADLADAALVIIPGTKNTRDDLRWLKEQGFAAAIRSAHVAGAGVIGVCGGFQMLGDRVNDPLGVEGEAGEEGGLGLLPLTTSFAAEKVTRRVRGRVANGAGLLTGLDGTEVNGYEIHMGATDGRSGAAFNLEDEAGPRPDGAVSADGRIVGTYMHGLFANDAFRRGLLANLQPRSGAPSNEGQDWDPEAGIDRLTAQAKEHLDLDLLKRIVGL
jgi:adenosylcobyric acid synthase